jgi:hypothetical protein
VEAIHSLHHSEDGLNKMNPEVKARWVAALRSGEYKQGKGALRLNNKFCCLGVLCDLYGDDYDALSAHNDGTSQFPPRTFAEIADAIEEQL